MSNVQHPDVQARRALLRKLNLCINASLPAEHKAIATPAGRVIHGPPVSRSGRCERCDHVYKHGKGRAIELGLISE